MNTTRLCGRWVLVGGLVAASMLAVGCKKKDSGGDAPAGGSAPAGAVAAAGQASGEQSGVMRYTEETPEGGTVSTRQPVKVRKAADDSSDVLTNLGPNTNVDKKARKGNYILVMWPSGVGQLSPGWVPAFTLTDQPQRVVTVVDAGAAAVATAAVTAAATAAATAAPTATTTAAATAAPTGTAASTAKGAATSMTPPGGRPPGPVKLPGKK